MTWPAPEKKYNTRLTGLMAEDKVQHMNDANARDNRPDVIQARQLAWERTAQAVAAAEAAAEIRSRLASAPRRERAAMAAEAARLDRAAEKAHRMARPWMRIATM